MSSEDNRIHFGALDFEIDEDDKVDQNPELLEALSKGNVNISNLQSDTLELSYSSLEDQEKHAKALRQFEEKRKSKSIVVPTDDTKVKQELRYLGQPICLFGEGPGDRRNRLRLVLAGLSTSGRGQDFLHREKRFSSSAEAQRPKKVLYTRAIPELIKARREIASYSWKKSKQRLQHLKRRKLERSFAIEFEKSVAAKYKNVRRFGVEGSQFGDTRPLSCCNFSNKLESTQNSKSTSYIATGSFSSFASIWSASTLDKLMTLVGHEERIVDIKFSTRKGSESKLLSTAGADKIALIWDLPENITPEKDVIDVHSKGKLEGHVQRLSKMAWHPLGRHIATSSFDTTWRFWDIETCKEILLQDGHEAAAYGIAFHPDGSLAASTDLNGIGRVWDVRSGKAIGSLTGHAMELLSVDFSPNGYHVATGGADHTARVFDLRQQKLITVIPGHSSTIARVQFSPSTGSFLATASYDKTMRIWNARDFGLLKVLEGHEGKVMDLNISYEEDSIVSCSYDKTWKLWKSQA